MRTLYLDLHRDEMTTVQQSQLEEYHNLNEIFAYEPDSDYQDYYKFYISRDPYARVVSAFLDQYLYAQNSGIEEMFRLKPPEGGNPQNFVDFLSYLKGVPDDVRDSHFQTQNYLMYENELTIRRWFRTSPNDAFAIDYVGDISRFNDHLIKVYKKIFRRHPLMQQRLRNGISNLSRLNSSYYGHESVKNAAHMSLAELNALPFAPKPQDFFYTEEALALTREIYAKDFTLFGYDLIEIPHKHASSVLAEIPADFDWKTYLMLSPDLPLNGISTQRLVMRHYLEFGRFETDTRSYKIEAPDGFEWQKYLGLHDDLRMAGIDNERDAIIHYLAYGRDEGRVF